MMLTWKCEFFNAEQAERRKKTEFCMLRLPCVFCVEKELYVKREQIGSFSLAKRYSLHPFTVYMFMLFNYGSFVKLKKMVSPGCDAMFFNSVLRLNLFVGIMVTGGQDDLDSDQEIIPVGS